ncbi:MAG: TetR/AcrR family transcriptional regulator [Cyclobacteriaceae bacterium]|nr:TetR/AcrR family transcriptional regulator [Cyclobacteriaceae bacterium]
MSPRTSAKNEEIRQESMQKIMNAAFSLIARQGYESTSISQIAAEAGVSKGLMYNYFDSKEDLLEQLVKGAMDQGDKMIAEMMDTDPVKTLRNMFEWFFNEMRERPDYWRLMTELTFKIDKFKFIHDLATEKAKGYTLVLEGLLKQMNFPNPTGEAKLVGALFDGIAIQYLVIRKDYPLDEIESYLIEKYCKR